MLYIVYVLDVMHVVQALANCFITLSHDFMQSWAESRAKGLQTYTQQQASKHSRQATGVADTAATDSQSDSQSDSRSVVDLTLLSDSDEEHRLDSDVGRQLAEADQLQLWSGCKEEGQLQPQEEERTECEEEELPECQEEERREPEEEDQLEYESLQSELELNLDDTSEEEEATDEEGER